ncbi:hypothetical protein LTR67_002745 [Exophiala xenobiotica]
MRLQTAVQVRKCFLTTTAAQSLIDHFYVQRVRQAHNPDAFSGIVPRWVPSGRQQPPIHKVKTLRRPPALCLRLFNAAPKTLRRPPAFRLRLYNAAPKTLRRPPAFRLRLVHAAPRRERRLTGRRDQKLSTSLGSVSLPAPNVKQQSEGGTILANTSVTSAATERHADTEKDFENHQEAETEHDPTEVSTTKFYTVRPSRLFTVKLPQENILSSVKALKLARARSLPEQDVALDPFNLPLPAPRAYSHRQRRDYPLAAKMMLDLRRKRIQAEGIEILRRRYSLPLFDSRRTRATLIQTIDGQDVTIVLAKTGSGKTTQIPQLILDTAIERKQGPVTRILCAEPRRIAATSTARRVAFERGEPLGESVGYHIRNDSELPRQKGSITYCTIGILLHRLLTQGWQMLQGYSHIILDEVHERDAQLDLVLSLVRRHLDSLKASGLAYPKVILMSATIDPSSFIDYFVQPGSSDALTAASFEVEGSGYPVETHYLPDILTEISAKGELHPTMQALLQGKSRNSKSSAGYIKEELAFAALDDKGSKLEVGSKEQNAHRAQPSLKADAQAEAPDKSTTNTYQGLVMAVIAHISSTKPEGDILVFLPGKLDIDTIYDLLIETRPLDLNFEDESKFKLFKLHSTLRDTNDNVFMKVPNGCRRIILATNIAEASITLPEVVYVVDPGKSRTSFFDPITSKRSLPFQWISKTNAIQRRGRAGRVRPGHYYALFTEKRYETFLPMARPKITVSNLVDVVLSLAAHPHHGSPGEYDDPREFLRGMLDPPSEDAIEAAYRDLQVLEALDGNGRITRLGYLLAEMNIHAPYGKGVLLGALFGCLEPMLILACHDFNHPLIHNPELSINEVRESKRHFDRDLESDLPVLIEAFRAYHAAYQADDQPMLDQLRQERSIKHSAYLEMIMTSKAIHEALVKFGILRRIPSVFEALPTSLNFNRDNMILVKALAVNSVSAELAAWDAEKHQWTLNVPNLAFSSRASINYDKSSQTRRKKRKYRVDGRLMAYAWKSSNDESSGGEVWLEHSSMVTPLMMILFSRSATLESPQIIRLNDWLRFQFEVETIDATLAAHSARVLIETRKMLDRFITRTWLRILPNNVSRRAGSQDSIVTLGLRISRTRGQMVAAITKMLEADNQFWQTYRAKRRAKIDAEEAQLAEDARILAGGGSEATQDGSALAVEGSEKPPDAVDDEDYIGFGIQEATESERESHTADEDQGQDEEEDSITSGI